MIVEKDMATSRAEFFRNLGIALRGIDHKIDGNRISVAKGRQRIDMELAPLPARRLSPLLSLERWKLTMEFTGYSDAARQAFLNKFDQAFQRGGG